MIFLRHIKLVCRRYSTLKSHVRVRFAPSPTGFIHLGGLRTAFFNYLFAKKMKGKFILRIEDTDQKRIKLGSVENLNAMLDWAGLTPDESPLKNGDFGPYIQSWIIVLQLFKLEEKIICIMKYKDELSARLETYKARAEELLKSKAAYRCFCSEARLDILKKEALRTNENRGYDNKCRHLTPSEIQELLSSEKSFTIRFKVPEKSVAYDDMVFGNQSYNVSENEGDFIIMKSDGFPTYHFASVVDDHMMQISHVLRGTEWLISTPKHIMLYEAFGWESPKFAHLPLLTNSDRTKLSKRQESIGIEYFKNKGYSSDALLNFLAVAGGGFGKQEGCIVYDLQNLCSKFNLENVNKGSCIVDFRKLDLLNHNHLVQRMSNDESLTKLIQEFRQVLKDKFGQKYENEKSKLSNAYLQKLLHCYKDRIVTLSDMVENDMEYLWISPEYENVMQLLSLLKIPDSVVCSLKEVTNQLSQIPDIDFTQNNLSVKIKEICNHLNIKYSILMRALRVVLTGQRDGPGVSEILDMLGKEKSLEKISSIIEEITKRESKLFLE